MNARTGFILMNPLGPHFYVDGDPTGGVVSDAVTDIINHRIDGGEFPAHEHLQGHEPLGTAIYVTDAHDTSLEEVRVALLEDSLPLLDEPEAVGPQSPY